MSRSYRPRPVIETSRRRGRETSLERQHYATNSEYRQPPLRSRRTPYTGPPSTDTRYDNGLRSIPYNESRSREEEFYSPYDPYALNIPPPPYFLPPVLRQSSVHGSQPPPVISPYRPPLHYLNGQGLHHPSYYDQYHAGIPVAPDQDSETPDGVQVDFSALENVQNVPDKTAAALMPSIDAVTVVCGNVSKTLYMRTDDLQSRSGASTGEIEATALELSSFAKVLSNAREVLDSTERLISYKAFETINTLLLFCKKALQEIRSAISTSRKIPSRLNFLRRDSLNSSLGRVKAVRLNLECVKTSLTAILSTIVLAGRQDELLRVDSLATQFLAQSSETLADRNSVHQGQELSQNLFELDAAIQRSTSILEDDILANSRAVTRWQQAERREFEDLYVQGLVSVNMRPTSPASQWVSQLVPFEPLQSKLLRITGPEPLKAIGFGTEGVIASNSRTMINEQEEQARIAAVIQILLAKWTEIPPQLPESEVTKTRNDYVKGVPTITVEAKVASGPNYSSESQTPSRGTNPADKTDENVPSAANETFSEKKKKHVSFEEVEVEVEVEAEAEDKVTQEEVASEYFQLLQAESPSSPPQTAEEAIDRKNADIVLNDRDQQTGVKSDETQVQHRKEGSEVERNQTHNRAPNGHQLEPAPAAAYSRGKNAAQSGEFLSLDDDGGLPKAGWEHNRRNEDVFEHWAEMKSYPYPYPPHSPAEHYYGYPHPHIAYGAGSTAQYPPPSTNGYYGAGSTDQHLPPVTDGYYHDSSASRNDRPMRARLLFPTGEEPHGGDAWTVESMSGERSRASNFPAEERLEAEFRTREMEGPEPRRYLSEDYGSLQARGREPVRATLESRPLLQTDRYRGNGAYQGTPQAYRNRDSGSYWTRSQSEIHREEVESARKRGSDIDSASSDGSVVSEAMKNETKALVLSKNPFGAVVEQLTAELKAARRTIARKTELLSNTPSLKKVETLEADVARFKEERRLVKDAAGINKEASDRKVREATELIALLEASVAASTSKITTLEKRLSKRDATIKRLEREKEQREAAPIPDPPEAAPVPDPPEAVPDPPEALAAERLDAGNARDEVVVIEEHYPVRRGRNQSPNRRPGRRSLSISEYSYYTGTFSNTSKKIWTAEKVWEMVWIVSGVLTFLVIAIMMAASLATYLHSANGHELERMLRIMDVDQEAICGM